MNSVKAAQSGAGDGVLGEFWIDQKNTAKAIRTAVVAGSDTAATALGHLCYFLLNHPKYLELLRREVNEVFPDGQEPSD